MVARYTLDNNLNKDPIMVAAKEMCSESLFIFGKFGFDTEQQ